MNCWHCDRPAHGSCFFCGRAVCKQHVKTMPGLLQMFRDRSGILRGMVVDTVVWCGICNPKRYPVNLDAVDPAPLPDLAELPESEDEVPDLRDDTAMRVRHELGDFDRTAVGDPTANGAGNSFDTPDRPAKPATDAESDTDHLPQF